MLHTPLRCHRTSTTVRCHADCRVQIDDIEILCGTIDNALGSVGGYCVGMPQVVDHQRLSGAGTSIAIGYELHYHMRWPAHIPLVW